MFSLINSHLSLLEIMLFRKFFKSNPKMFETYRQGFCLFCFLSVLFRFHYFYVQCVYMCEVNFLSKYLLLQHLQDMLELDMSALSFMMKCFPEIKEVEDMRKSIGRYGLTGKQQVCSDKHVINLIETVWKTRVPFAKMITS